MRMSGSGSATLERPTATEDPAQVMARVEAMMAPKMPHPTRQTLEGGSDASREHVEELALQVLYTWRASS